MIRNQALLQALQKYFLQEAGAEAEVRMDPMDPVARAVLVVEANLINMVIQEPEDQETLLQQLLLKEIQGDMVLPMLQVTQVAEAVPAEPEEMQAQDLEDLAAQEQQIV